VSKQNSKAEINGRKMEKYKWELMKTLIMKTTNRKVIRKGTTYYLYCDSEIMILSIVLNYHFLIERLQRENNERRYV